MVCLYPHKFPCDGGLVLIIVLEVVEFLRGKAECVWEGGAGSLRTLSLTEFKLFSWDNIVSSHDRSCYDRTRLALP